MQKEIVAGALFLLTFISPTPTPPLQTSQIKQEEMTAYAVQKEDTLGSIAEKYYGSGDYWTNIWNINSWIENPNIIEKDWILNIKEKSDKPEELKKELAEKFFQRQIASTPIIQAQTEANQPQPTIITQSDTKPIATGATGPLNDTQINFLGNCESGMSAGRNSGNGYYGAFQFSPRTWISMGTAYERADLAPLEVQIEATQRLLSRSSIYNQFPGCAAKMRSAGLL